MISSPRYGSVKCVFYTPFLLGCPFFFPHIMLNLRGAIKENKGVWDSISYTGLRGLFFAPEKYSYAHLYFLSWLMTIPTRLQHAPEKYLPFLSIPQRKVTKFMDTLWRRGMEGGSWVQ